MGVLIPLVARAGVLAEAGSVLTAARAGRGALLTITGEPGIGKTRLAEEAAAQADGFEIIWTWCPAATGGAALRTWSRVVRVLAGGHTAVARPRRSWARASAATSWPSWPGSSPVS